MGIFKDCGCGCDGEVAKQKFIISLFAACIFYIVMNQETYKASSKLLGKWVMNGDCPSANGFLLHVFVFLAITFGSMMIRNRNDVAMKMKISLMSAAIFYIIASPKTFIFVNRLVGGWVSSASGCPTPLGLLLHSAVFLGIIYLTMNGKEIKNSDTITN